MTVAWVLGSSGLLGTALCRVLCCDDNNTTKLFFPTERFAWDDAHKLQAQIIIAVQEFATHVKAADRWELYWAAGIGTMRSATDEFVPEAYALSSVLRLLEADPHLMAVPGALVFASSAGAIYAGSKDDIITENTAPAPTTVYAHTKLRQEEQVRKFALAHNQCSALIARISTLYGMGQSTGKQQGLISHIARSMLRNRPIQIYVPYDTIRDYITTNDAATAIVAALRATSETSGVVTKIIASERPVTIAEIISIFKRITRHTPRIVTSASRLSNLYSRRIQFRSITLPKCKRAPMQNLPVGIAQLMAAELAAFTSRR